MRDAEENYRDQIDVLQNDLSELQEAAKAKGKGGAEVEKSEKETQTDPTLA